MVSMCELTSTDLHTHTHTCGGDPVLSVEEELRFAIRFEEGYDLFDPRNEAWLKSKHLEAEAIDKSTTAPLAPNTPLKLQVSDPPSKASLANTPQTYLTRVQCPYLPPIVLHLLICHTQGAEYSQNV